MAEERCPIIASLFDRNNESFKTETQLEDQIAVITTIMRFQSLV